MVRTSLIVLALLIILVATIGYSLPRERKVTRSITINAPASTIFQALETWDGLAQWSPWFELDPDASYQYSGPDRGVGATVEWRGDDSVVGVGRQEIVAIDPGTSVTSRFVLDDYPQGLTTLSISPRQRGSRVSATIVVDAGRDLLHRFRGATLDESLGRDYERALVNLRDYIEALPKTVANPQEPTLVVDVDAIPVLFVDAQRTATFNEREAARLLAFQYVWEYAYTNEIEVSGMPIGFVTDDESGRFGYRAALPLIEAEFEPAPGFGATNTYEGRAVRAIHSGSYDGIGEAHAAAQDFLEQLELESSGPPWELYVDDRETTPPESRRFHVYYPLD